MSYICPRCQQNVYSNDYVRCQDESYWHTRCYRDAALAAGQPDPFPQYAQVGGVPPSAGAEEAKPDTPASEAKPEQPATVPLPLTVRDKPPCRRCGKPVQKSLSVLWSHEEQIWFYYHRSCARKPSMRAARKSKGAEVEKPSCTDCEKTITGEPVECADPKNPGQFLYYHKKCYRQLFIARGMPDPFAPTATTTLCSECEPPKQIKREAFLAHLAEHRRQRAVDKATAEVEVLKQTAEPEQPPPDGEEAQPELPLGDAAPEKGAAEDG